MRVIRASPDLEWIAEEVVKVLAGAGVAVVPTDTCYGVAADALNPEAVEKVFRVKKRPLEKPVSVFVSSIDEIRELCVVDRVVEKSFGLLPGRVTLILRARRPEIFPPGIVSPRNTIGVRISPHPLPTLIASKLGRPITATSANISGEEPIYDPREVLKRLMDVDLLVDAGILPRVPVSTIIDLTVSPPRILRKGPVAREEIERVLGVQVTE